MPGLRDRFGRLISRVRGTQATSRNQYASVIARKIEEAKANRDSGQARADSYLDRLRIERERRERIQQVIRQGREDIRNDVRQMTNDSEPEMGIARDVGPENWEVPWIPVSSSNVEAIRWVGGNWGLQVRFKKKGWEYEYHVGHGAFQQMLHAPSKGQFVWWLRRSKVPYHRLTAGTGPSTLAYEWGRVLVKQTMTDPRTGRSVTGNVLMRNPEFQRRPLK